MSIIQYSPRPVRDYVRVVNGVRIGPGVDPRITANPAAWNLYFLSYPNLENHTDFGGASAVELLPGLDPVAELAVITAGQFAGGARVRDLCLMLPAADFVQQMRRRPIDQLVLAKFLKPQVWLGVMEMRSVLCARPRPTGQQDGTSAAKSTNILPLARLVH